MSKQSLRSIYKPIPSGVDGVPEGATFGGGAPVEGVGDDVFHRARFPQRRVERREVVVEVERPIERLLAPHTPQEGTEIVVCCAPQSHIITPISRSENPSAVGS